MSRALLADQVACAAPSPRTENDPRTPPPALPPGAEVEYVGPPLPLAGVRSGDVGTVLGLGGVTAPSGDGRGRSCVVRFPSGVRLVVSPLTTARFRLR